jgi:hypothetical protein
MTYAPFHIYEQRSPSDGGWRINPFYQSRDGRSLNDSEAEQYYKDVTKNADGIGDSDDKMFSFLDRATDKQFDYQKQLMGLTNQYRTKEGATQGQMDEQAFRRLKTQVDSQQFMQRQGADLTERQRGYDSNRAIRAFKGNF